MTYIYQRRNEWGIIMEPIKSMDTVDRIIEAANSFYKELQEDKNARFRSWEHCYKSFHDARNKVAVDRDYLCLHLAFYLASWGMYRGSSFLLKKDYKVHEPVVKELLDSKYDCLSGLECKLLREKEVQKRLEELVDFMVDYYDKIRMGVKKNEVKKKPSPTLITKILMGTLGCAPAYDRYFTESVKELKVATGLYDIKSLVNSLIRLENFYDNNNNYERLEKARQKFKVSDNLEYPQMKLLDMAFWEIGFEKAQI